jgi:hypothetical protein
MVECYNFFLFLTDLSFIGSSDPLAVTADAPNELLSELLFEQLKQIHDKELQLTLEDCMWFLQLLHARERDGTAYSLPIPVPLSHHPARKIGGSCYLKNLAYHSMSGDCSFLYTIHKTCCNQIWHSGLIMKKS